MFRNSVQQRQKLGTRCAVFLTTPLKRDTELAACLRHRIGLDQVLYHYHKISNFNSGKNEEMLRNCVQVSAAMLKHFFL